MRQIRAGDVFRICTPNFEGPWRKAHDNAMLVGKVWSVPVRQRNHRDPFIFNKKTGKLR